MNSVKDVENILEKEKWILISKAMDKRGATGYPINFLQKKHKEFTEAIKAGTAGDLLGAMMQEFDGAEREARGEGSGLDSDKDVKEEVTA